MNRLGFRSDELDCGLILEDFLAKRTQPRVAREGASNAPYALVLTELSGFKRTLIRQDFMSIIPPIISHVYFRYMSQVRLLSLTCVENYYLVLN